MSIQNKVEPVEAVVKPTREEAEEAVRTLICWTGDNPDREGLIETPKRVVKAYEEFFEGYNMDPEEVLTKTFEEVQGLELLQKF